MHKALYISLADVI